jgi:hypothetical protein
VKFVSPGVKPESVSGDSFYVYPASGGSALAADVVYDESTCTATLTPRTRSRRDRVQGHARASVTAEGGMTLGGSGTWQFTTGDA